MGRLQYSLFKAQLQSGDPNGRNVKVSPRSCLFAQRRKLQFPFAIFSQIAQQVILRARCICKESPQVPTLLKSKKKPPSCQVLQENRNSFDVILAKADTLKQLAGPVYLKGDSRDPSTLSWSFCKKFTLQNHFVAPYIWRVKPSTSTMSYKNRRIR